MLGRRGPLQAAFTNPEVRELGKLKGATAITVASEVALDPLSAAHLQANPDPYQSKESRNPPVYGGKLHRRRFENTDPTFSGFSDGSSRRRNGKRTSGANRQKRTPTDRSRRPSDRRQPIKWNISTQAWYSVRSAIVACPFLTSRSETIGVRYPTTRGMSPMASMDHASPDCSPAAGSNVVQVASSEPTSPMAWKPPRQCWRRPTED